MWFGYIAQVEVVNGGGLANGKIGPARTTLSRLGLVGCTGRQNGTLTNCDGSRICSDCSVFIFSVVFYFVSLFGFDRFDEGQFWPKLGGFEV